MGLFSFLTGAIWLAIKSVFKIGCLLLPAFLVFVVLNQPSILLNRGIPVINDAQEGLVHEILPRTRWGNLKPCSQYFDEQEHFERALSCVNDKVWPDSPLVDTDLSPLVPPRCFIVSAESPDVFSAPDGTFNFIPLIDIFGIGAVVGVYQPETRTVFVVENVDAAMVYRHELQHVFLHLHNPETGGGGHYQDIWKKCEPPYYTPTVKAEVSATLKDLKQDK